MDTPFFYVDEKALVSVGGAVILCICGCCAAMICGGGYDGQRHRHELDMEHLRATWNQRRRSGVMWLPLTESSEDGHPLGSSWSYSTEADGTEGASVDGVT
jgi:hypothetical protein